MVERATYRTTDIDEAHEFIRRMYVGHKGPRFSGSPERFEFQVGSAAANQISFDRVRHTMATVLDTEVMATFTLATPGRGVLRFDAGRYGRINLVPGSCALFPLYGPMHASWENIELLMLRLPKDRTVEIAAAQAGIAPHELQFYDMKPISPTMTRHMNRTIAYVMGDLCSPDPAADHLLVASEMQRLLAITALQTFPNTTHTSGADQQPGPGAPAPRTLRHALAYIEDHAAEPITLTHIAAAARLSPRALQVAFRRHLDTTPTAYLRRARLERAHHDLQAADPTTGATVTDIARGWGFVRLDRFTSLYRQTYGTTPRKTLRQ